MSFRLRSPAAMSLAVLLGCAGAPPVCVERPPKGDLRFPSAKSYAILLGINDYSGANLRSLHWPEKQTRRLESLLAAQGYSTCVLTGRDATAGNMERIRAYLRGKVGSSLVLFFFSGHGLQAPSGNGCLRFAMKLGAGQGDLALETVLDSLSALGPKQLAGVVEACYSGRGGAGRLPGGIPYHRSYLDANVFLLTAMDTMVTETALSDPLLRGLAGRADDSAQGNRDGYVDALELGEYLVGDRAAGSEGAEVRYLTFGSGSMRLCAYPRH